MLSYLRGLIPRRQISRQLQMKWETPFWIGIHIPRRQISRQPKFPAAAKWHRHFAFLPVACIDDMTRWLCIVERIGCSQYMGGGLWRNRFSYRSLDHDSE